ncbi:hypothetical protein CBR_g24031 [Chara braunii]|uniref:Uncharacterized protein n=1 Tax=Chara braunii TaxID=69332 RepID=A0A388L5K0_CHABU|nr:hypothetical protein CBR_g24031 [Chara braunii]|eukprot:GBG77584.1 hypothetical protein CBR_g24031 [Chara braunii]
MPVLVNDLVSEESEKEDFGKAGGVGMEEEAKHSGVIGVEEGDKTGGEGEQEIVERDREEGLGVEGYKARERKTQRTKHSEKKVGRFLKAKRRR